MDKFSERDGDMDRPYDTEIIFCGVTHVLKQFADNGSQSRRPMSNKTNVVLNTGNNIVDVGDLSQLVDELCSYAGTAMHKVVLAEKVFSVLVEISLKLISVLEIGSVQVQRLNDRSYRNAVIQIWLVIIDSHIVNNGAFGLAPIIDKLSENGALLLAECILDELFEKEKHFQHDHPILLTILELLSWRFADNNNGFIPTITLDSSNKDSLGVVRRAWILLHWDALNSKRRQISVFHQNDNTHDLLVGCIVNLKNVIWYSYLNTNIGLISEEGILGIDQSRPCENLLEESNKIFNGTDYLDFINRVSVQLDLYLYQDNFVQLLKSSLKSNDILGMEYYFH